MLWGVLLQRKKKTKSTLFSFFLTRARIQPHRCFCFLYFDLTVDNSPPCLWPFFSRFLPFLLLKELALHSWQRIYADLTAQRVYIRRISYFFPSFSIQCFAGSAFYKIVNEVDELRVALLRMLFLPFLNARPLFFFAAELLALDSIHTAVFFSLPFPQICFFALMEGR